MKAFAATLLATGFALAVGCTAPSRHPTARLPRSAGISTPSPPPSPVTLPTLQLIADLASPPVRWQKVAFIPFGTAERTLGFHAFHESLSSMPSSFLVAPDGSFWIDDRWKTRLAHYSASGRFLGALDGLYGRGFDVALVGSQLYVLLREANVGGLGARIAAWKEGGWREFDLIDHGHPVMSGFFIPSSTELLIETAGWADTDTNSLGPRGIARVDAETGRVQLLPGVPLRSGGSVSFKGIKGDDGGTMLHWMGPHIDLAQPFHIRILAQREGRTRTVQGGGGAWNAAPDGDDLLMFMIIGPSDPRPEDGRYGNGHWLLRMGPSPLLWERVPSAGIADEPQNRDIAVGPDDAIYLMVAQKGGEEILRRP